MLLKVSFRTSTATRIFSAEFANSFATTLTASSKLNEGSGDLSRIGAGKIGHDPTNHRKIEKVPGKIGIGTA